MRILPVLDLLNGIVVRGVAGRRSEYRPIVSRLVDRPEPLAVAEAFRLKLGLNVLYVADLDAILRDEPNRDVYRQLEAAGFELSIDAGLRSVAAAEKLLSTGGTTAVVGLESWPGPAALDELFRAVDGRRVIFSLDLQSEKTLGDSAAWGTDDSAEIVARAVAAGARRMIVLDLAQVGVSAGVATMALCRRIRERHPQLELITGGGVRDVDDLLLLRDAGLDGVLVASALHDGRVTRNDLDQVGAGGT